MKCLVMKKEPFGITEYPNLMSIDSYPPGSVISGTVSIQYMSNGSTVVRIIDTNEYLVQIVNE